jgi:hypothetical protein
MWNPHSCVKTSAAVTVAGCFVNQFRLVSLLLILVFLHSTSQNLHSFPDAAKEAFGRKVRSSRRAWRYIGALTQGGSRRHAIPQPPEMSDSTIDFRKSPKTARRAMSRNMGRNRLKVKPQ